MSQIINITLGAVGKPAVNSIDYSLDPNPWGPWLALRRLPSDGSRSRYACRCVRCGNEEQRYGGVLRTARRQGHKCCRVCRLKSDEEVAAMKAEP